MENATDVAEMQELARDNRCLMIDAGVTQSPHLLELTMKPAVLRALGLHHIVHSRAELDQFRDGLNCLRVLECVKAKPDLMKIYFLAPIVPLTAGESVPTCPVVAANYIGLHNYYTQIGNH